MLFAEAPPDRPPTWRPPPDSRGSFTILSACLITLTLCIWTSLHLNIPEHNNGTSSRRFQLGPKHIKSTRLGIANRLGRVRSLFRGQDTTKRSEWDPRSWITKQFLRKVGWLIIGLLAPEMVCSFGSMITASAEYDCLRR